LNDGLVDVWGAFAKAWFGAPDDEAKKQVVAKFENDDFKTMLDRYDKFLAANGTGYFVGSKVLQARNYVMLMFSFPQNIFKFSSEFSNLI